MTKSYAQKDCLCNVYKNLSKIDLQDSVQYKKAINTLKSAENKNCEFESLTLKIKKHIIEKQFNIAFTLLKQQENLLVKLDCKNYFEYNLLTNKMSYYRAINDLEKLSDTAFKTLEKAEKLNDIRKEIDALQNIVFVFTRLNEDKKNWTYIQRAKELIESLDSKKETINYYIWLALEYETKYTITERKSLIDSSLIFINKAKRIALKNNLKVELSEIYKVLEACAYHKKELKKAVKYIDSSIYYAKSVNPTLNLGPLYIYKSWDLLDLIKFSEVEKSLDSAIMYDKSIGGAKMAFYHELSEIYNGIGKNDKALFNYKKYTNLKDSILNIKKLEKVNDLELKYNKVINENKIVQLKKTKQLYSSLIIGGLLAMFIVILVFLYNFDI